jgi:hypothetical protein
MANTYLLLYSGGQMPSTPDEQKASMDAWGAWFGRYGEAIADAGNPFTQASKTISPDGSVSEGARAAASGYTLVKADSLDKAVEIAKGSPVLIGGGTISVYETFDVMAAMAPSQN